jgi:hypothetical protein
MQKIHFARAFGLIFRKPRSRWGQARWAIPPRYLSDGKDITVTLKCSRDGLLLPAEMTWRTISKVYSSMLFCSISEVTETANLKNFRDQHLSWKASVRCYWQWVFLFCFQGAKCIPDVYWKMLEFKLNLLRDSS